MRPRNHRSWARLLPVLMVVSAVGKPWPGCTLRADEATPEPAPPEVRSSGPDVPAAPETPVDKPKQRQREGVKLSDRRGRFERRGERYVFLSDAPVGHFLVLENLMLERVANVLSDAAGGQLRWSVTGTVTEYRGVNYLLLDRAVVKASQDDGEPQRPNEPQSKLTSRPPERLPAPTQR